MSQKRQRSNQIVVDIRTPNRIIKENEDNKNTYLVQYDNNYVFEDKNYSYLHYFQYTWKSITQNQLKIIIYLLQQEKDMIKNFFNRRLFNLPYFIIQENPIIEQYLLDKNKRVQIKQQRKQTIKHKCLNFLDIQINSQLKDKNLAIKIKANDGNITNQPIMEKLIKITHELQSIGYTQDELIVSFTLKKNHQFKEDKTMLIIDKTIKMND